MNKQKNLENVISAMQDLNLIISQIKKHLSANDTSSIIPEIEIDLALEKTRKLYSELLYINNFSTDIPENIKNKIPIKTEPVTEKKQKSIQIQEPLIEFEAIKAEKLSIDEKVVEQVIQEVKPEITEPPKNTATEMIQEQKKESIIDFISKQTRTEDFASRLQQKPIADINEAIGLGEKLLYINELFDKNPTKYADSVKEMNGFTRLDDAMAYINSNFSWNTEKETTISFLEIVKRKFPV